MTISTEELRKLVAGNRFSSIAEVRDLATEILAARAKLEAAEKLAEALDAWGTLYRGWSRAQLARRVDAPTEKRFYDGEAALAAWEAAQ